VELPNGNWGAIQITLGFNVPKAPIRHLLYLEYLTDGILTKKPKFLMVITAGAKSFVDENGIYFVPLGLLKP
jgi:hypothetical protein